MSAELIADPSVRPAIGRGWNNPIFRRYCRSRLRPKKLFVSMLVVVLVAAFTTAMSQMTARYRGHMSEMDAARMPIVPLLMLQGVILFILGTAQSSGGMVAERDEGGSDYQRLLPMKPLAKVLGYLFGLPVAEYALVLATLPFTGWSLWKGDVPFSAWGPLYGVFFSTGILYHCTGLVTGMVVNNRRWAFLASIGLVFSLYTIVPQASKFGLVFFKYLTITPVFEEQFSSLIAKRAGDAVEIGQLLIPQVKFFGLNFSEMVFTLFSQSGLVVTFLIMLCRKWRRGESHLLGKLWATLFFVWIQVLLLGNALPLIETGQLFPSYGLNNVNPALRMLAGNRRIAERLHLDPGWQPSSGEAGAMAAIYGCVTLGLVWIFAAMITPAREQQLRGWRRARKIGHTSLPFFGDSATGSWAIAVMALAGAGGWYLFSRGLFESHWFGSQSVGLPVFGCFAAVMLAAGLGAQLLLEWQGVRPLVLVTILGGVLPVMVGSVAAVIDNSLASLSTWLIGISPVMLPVYAVGSLLAPDNLPSVIERAVPRALTFWLLVDLLLAVWLAIRLYRTRREMAQRILAESVGGADPAA